MGPSIDKRLCLGDCAVEDGKGKTGIEKMGTHVLPHDSGSNPAHAGV